MTESHQDNDQSPHRNTPPPARCPVFTPQQLQRQLTTDSVIRWGFVAAVVAYLTLSSNWTDGDSTWSGLLAFMVIGAWFAMSVIGTRVAQQIPQITVLLEHDPTAAESQLAQVIVRKPIPRSIRLLLYHRLAMLRHQQHRFGEVAAICQTVLSKLRLPVSRETAAVATRDNPEGADAWVGLPGDIRQIRSNLLLMLVEARLWCNDFIGAYVGLQQLQYCRLALVDTMRLLIMQTRYEIAVGYNDATLNRIEQKIQLAELMPAVQCGAMHAMLAVAAIRANQPSLGDWLRRRAQLLCTPDQLKEIGVVGASIDILQS